MPQHESGSSNLFCMSCGRKQRCHPIKQESHLPRLSVRLVKPLASEKTTAPQWRMMNILNGQTAYCSCLFKARLKDCVHASSHWCHFTRAGRKMQEVRGMNPNFAWTQFLPSLLRNSTVTSPSRTSSQRLAECFLGSTPLPLWITTWPFSKLP